MESLRRRNSKNDGNGRNTGVDLVLSCVDNYEARMVVNQVIRASNEFTIACAQLYYFFQFLNW
ncbi:Ubiquitin-like modifier-activating enzyme 5 [Platanthera guangdongensis]|uniref:Ubiquitin-like modifier-activating enzyme 5 n=1 Tax=Platanthera guangdongensis TaxID=2320717 RepID=A0ABR2MEF4_9ASPA